jgi:hypothetical protein
LDAKLCHNIFTCNYGKYRINRRKCTRSPKRPLWYGGTIKKEFITTSRIDEQTLMKHFTQLYCTETGEKNNKSAWITVEVSDEEADETVMKKYRTSGRFQLPMKC